MTENTILIVVVCMAVLCLLLFAWVVFRRQRPKKEEIPYVAALNALVSGDRKAALQKLNETVRVDSQNVDAYLKLGNLLREEGDVERALKIHKSLTVRSLSPDQRMGVMKELASDYVAAKKYTQARELIEEVLSNNKKELWALEILLMISEETKQWERAFETLKQIQRLRGEEDNGLLALYKVCAGRILDERREHHRARLKYKEAIRIDERCTPAYLHLGDSYVAEHRTDDAITSWSRLIETVPEHAYLTFDRLEKAHFELGDFSSVAQTYRDLIDRAPDDDRPLFALVNILEKMGHIDEAISLCHQVLERDPGSQRARWSLVRCYHSRGDDVSATTYALELEKRSRVAAPFRCKVCGCESEHAVWRCPKCKNWRTFL